MHLTHDFVNCQSGQTASSLATTLLSLDCDTRTDMKIKLDCAQVRNEKEKDGLRALANGWKPRALIRTKYLDGECSTAEAIIQDLAEAFNDTSRLFRRVLSPFLAAFATRDP